VQVGKRPLPGKIFNRLVQSGEHAHRIGVITAVNRRVGLNVLGGNDRPEKNKVVIEVIATKNPGKHRVEKSFGQFWLLVAAQQGDVIQLGLLPDSFIQ